MSESPAALALAELAASLDQLPNTKERAVSKSTQYPIFSTSVLICYLQGEASPLFMESALTTMEEALNYTVEEQRKFLQPLFLLLHNNKNLKFRPINSKLLSDSALVIFSNYLEAFRKETLFDAFLENYKDFLLFLTSESLPVKEDKVFRSLRGLIVRITEYRKHCVVQNANNAAGVLSEVDLADLNF